MKFKISKSKSSVPKKETNLTEKLRPNRIINLNQEIKDAERESKSANMLFSLKSKTKMKRSHQKMNGLVINTVIACQNDKNKGDQINEKNLKKVNFKQFGSTFANLFKSNVRLKHIFSNFSNCFKKPNSIASNEKLKIDNEKIFFPIPIRFDSRKKESREYLKIFF